MPNYSDNAPSYRYGAPMGRANIDPPLRVRDHVRLWGSEEIGVVTRLCEGDPFHVWAAFGSTVRLYDVSTLSLVKRRSWNPKVSLQRIRLNSGGYDPRGAYWGHGAPLYWAATDCGTWERTFRAPDRAAAKSIVLGELPGASFHR